MNNTVLPMHAWPLLSTVEIISVLKQIMKIKSRRPVPSKKRQNTLEDWSKAVYKNK